MSRGLSKFRACSGFTLLEVIVIVAILAILAALLAPTAKGMILESKANQIIDLVDRLKEPCQRYYIDTGRFAAELHDGISMMGGALNRHELYLEPEGVVGWKGPYIDRPVTGKDNPEGGGVYLNDLLKFGDFPGFTLGKSGNLKAGFGNSLVLTKIPEELARVVDGKLDGSSVSANWRQGGRVAYIADEESLLIFILAETD